MLKTTALLQQYEVTTEAVEDVHEHGLNVLANLHELVFLEISDVRLPDLSTLAELKNLETLILCGNKVDKQRVRQLKKILPECEIEIKKQKKLM